MYRRKTKLNLDEEFIMDFMTSKKTNEVKRKCFERINGGNSSGSSTSTNHNNGNNNNNNNNNANVNINTTSYGISGNG